MLAINLELNSKGLYQSSEIAKESSLVVFVFSASSTNDMMHVQSCFANLNRLLFCRSCCRRCHRSLTHSPRNRS